MSGAANPERLSVEWHARHADGSADASERVLATGLMPHPEMERDIIEVNRDLASKLRELAQLREYALDGDGTTCERCDTVCLPYGNDGSEIWGTTADEDERITLCATCSHKAHKDEERDKQSISSETGGAS